MSQLSDVAFAVTLQSDKTIRETCRMLAAGHEVIEMMDGMFVREMDGWKLYHDSGIRWYYADDPAVLALHDMLSNLIDADEDCADYYVMHVENIPDGLFDHQGSDANPFGISYTLGWSYTRDERKHAFSADELAALMTTAGVDPEAVQRVLEQLKFRGD